MSKLHLRTCLMATVAALTLAVTATSQGEVVTPSGLVPVTSSSTGFHHLSTTAGHRHAGHGGRHHHRSAAHRHLRNK